MRPAGLPCNQPAENISEKIQGKNGVVGNRNIPQYSDPARRVPVVDCLITQKENDNVAGIKYAVVIFIEI